MQKLLIILGIVLILIGIFYHWILKLELWHLPGDIVIKKENITFYFPFMTGILLSIIFSIIIWLFHK